MGPGGFIIKREFVEQDDYWRMESSKVSTIFSIIPKGSTDHLNLKKSGERLGSIGAGFCLILDSLENFKAILFVNSKADIPTSSG